MRGPGKQLPRGRKVRAGGLLRFGVRGFVAGGGRRGGLELRDSREAQAGAGHSLHRFDHRDGLCFKPVYISISSLSVTVDRNRTECKPKKKLGEIG